MFIINSTYFEIVDDVDMKYEGKYLHFELMIIYVMYNWH